MPRKGRKRIRKDITLDIEIYKWVEDKIEEGVFFNFSHACEFALRKLKDEIEKPRGSPDKREG